jgi:hypothetical protein
MWTLVASNGALGVLLEGVADELLEPPVSCMRLAPHPDGMAPRILNLGDWRAHLLARLERQIALTGDERLADLHAEMLRYPGPEPEHLPSAGDVMVKLELASADGPLTFFSTVTTFGTAVDITLAELSIERRSSRLTR